jgi:plasmid stability protein
VSNLTLSLDDEILKRARIRALEQGTSVNAVVREFLAAYGGLDDERRARHAFVTLSEDVASGKRSGGRTWRREDLYDERARWPRS